MSILKEHNVGTYKKLEEMILRDRRAALVQAMGTGKSFIAMQLLHDHFDGMSILYMAPQDSIINNFNAYKENNFENIEYMTYQSLIFKTDEELWSIGKSHMVIILDELHRTGGKVWNEKINEILRHVSSITTVLGLTATPIRYLDNSRDMAEEFFGNNVVEGITLAQGIASGVLPSVEYVSAIYRVEERIVDYRKKLKETKDFSSEVLAKFNLNLENTEKIYDIVRKQIAGRSRIQKWIVFCESQEQAVTVDSDLKLWFGDGVDLFTVISNQTKAQNDEQQNLFIAKRSGINIIKTVDMFNEGIHVEGLTGIIMLRKTCSPNIWYQQLGRALACSSSCKRVTVFDFVGNFSSLKSVHAVGTHAVDFQREIRGISDKPELFIIKDYSIPVVDLFNKIENELNVERLSLPDFRRTVFELRANNPDISISAIHKIVGKGRSIKDIKDVLTEFKLSISADSSFVD